MKKITLFFMSLFLAFGTAMAEEDDTFWLAWMTPEDNAMVTEVYNIRLTFNHEISITQSEVSIDVKSDKTDDIIKITSCAIDEWNPYCAVFSFEKVEIDGKDGKEYQDQYIADPGTYTYTIPAGLIKSVFNGEEFYGGTYTFSVVSTFEIVDWSPKEASSVENIVVTFDREITEANMPTRGLEICDDWYYLPVTKVSDIVIADDKKSATLVFETPITTPGGYFLNLSQGTFVSGEAISAGTSAWFKVVDPAPRFETNYQDGDKVKELGNFEITFKNVKEVVLLQDKLTVYLPGSGEAEGTATLADNKITVTFNQQFTEEGDYLFYIPEGMFTMDGVKNEERQINVNLYTFSITPLEIVSVTPAVGKVDQIEQIIITFNQVVTPSYDADWQMISRELSLTCGDKTYTLTYAPEGYNATNQLRYIANAVWKETNYELTPITDDGTYVLNLGDIVVDHAGEEGFDDWGYATIVWHSKNVACQGTYTWTIGNDAAVDNIKVANGEQAIYDLLGRRVERITEAGLYIVNGKKVIIK